MTLIVTRLPTHEFDDPTVWRVVDGEWMKTEDIPQDWLVCLRKCGLKVDPQQSVRILQRGSKRLNI